MEINTYDKLLAMFLLQKANLATYKTEVGATADDLTEVSEAADNMQYMQDYWDLANADNKTLTGMKRQMYDGDPDAGIGKFGGFAAFSPPFPLVAGLENRAQKRNRRFKAAAGYTKEIGIALGIDGDSSSVTPGSVVPTVEAFPAQSNYECAAVAGNRGDSTMWTILGRRLNSEKWVELKSGTGKSINFHIEPTTPGQPEKMEIKIQLLKNNEPYGQQSAPVYVTLNP